MGRSLLAVLVAACLAPHRAAVGQGSPSRANASWYLFGRVTLEDGSPPAGPVSIQNACGSQSYIVAVTDSQGWFHFQYGAGAGRSFQDASAGMADGSFGRAAGSAGALTSGEQASSQTESSQAGGSGSAQPQSSAGAPPGGGFSERQLRSCELRASAPGFRSDAIPLGNRRAAENPNLGTLILHPLARTGAPVVSAASLGAPKDARKAYRAGLTALKKKQPAEARAEFEKATELYAAYAAAWCEIGGLDEREGRTQDAMRAYDAAIRADPQYLGSYLRLATLLAAERQWSRLGEASGQAIKLDPIHYPLAYYFHALADYHAGSMESAKRSAREAERLDQRRRFPDTWLLMGWICAARREFQEAAEQLREYLRLAPHAANSAAARAELALVERRTVESPPPAQGPPR